MNQRVDPVDIHAVELLHGEPLEAASAKSEGP
jgi:hypothetical protein